MKSAFESLAPFIQDYIYQNNWQELRNIQVAACDVIFNTQENLLLASGTASGKTEAAFLPIITDLYNFPVSSVGVLYISPLKALINDQFLRLEDIIKQADLSVTKWHGDVSQAIKQKLIKKPNGILQITPESLEAMLMLRKNDVIRLFNDLRYIVIDEVHYFMNNERGIQLLCILERIQRLISKKPRRIGLSATLGDYELAKNWLNSSTGKNCILANSNTNSKILSVHLESFEIPLEEEIKISEYYNYLYNMSKHKKCIIFSNSKSDVESNIANLKKIAISRGEKDVYYAHHANISSSYREEVESKMKNEDEDIVTGATMTLELGIDIGKLDRIIQTDTLYSVSSFVQRMGRSGRKTGKSEMLFVLKRTEPKKSDPFNKQINFKIVLCIAIIELYLKERWVEPLDKNTLPFSLLYHQTMSELFSNPGYLPKELAAKMLTLTPFCNISKEDYKLLLKYLINKEELELDEEGKLLIGKRGEIKVNNYDFFSIFETNIEYSVRNGSHEIGTVQVQFPKGEKFSLAGFTWLVKDIDENKKQIFVEKVTGISHNSWNGDIVTFLHTKIVKKVQDILLSDEEYSYLSKEASKELESSRKIARYSSIIKDNVFQISDNTIGIAPWMGTKGMLALSLSLKYLEIQNELVTEHSIPLYIEIKTEMGITEIKKTLKMLKKMNIDKYQFEINENMIKLGKYYKYIPNELLRKQFLEDFVDIDEMKKYI